MKKRSLSLVLAFAMILALSCGAWAALTPNADGVYEIGTAAELAEFRDGINDGTIPANSDAKLMANITLPDEAWMPIGTWVYESGTSLDYTYQGIFDGNGKQVNGLKVRSSDLAITSEEGALSYRAGFFGIVSDDGVILNLVLNDADIDLSDMSDRATVGAIAAENTGILQNSGVIGGSLIGSNITVAIGGVVGRVGNQGKVQFCYAKQMTELTGLGTLGVQVGGVAGTLDNESSMSNCYASNIDVIRGLTVGGVVAYMRTATTEISDCYAQGIGELIADEASAGGAGQVGGVVGYVSATTTQPYTSAKVTNCVYVGTIATTISGDNYEGGIVGLLRRYQQTLSYVQNCSYPDNMIFIVSDDKPIGNAPLADINTAGREDLLPYNASADATTLPAIVAALEQGYTVSLVVGETYDLDVSIFPGTSGDFACGWSSANSGVVSVTSGSGGLTATLTAVEVGTTEVTVRIRGVLNTDLTCIVNVTDTVEPAISGTPADDGSIYPDEEVNLTYDFSPYIAVGVDNSGMQTDISGLLAEILNGNVVVTGIAKEPGTYYYVVTLENANGVRFTQRVDVVIQGGSRPTGGGGGGSSNCNSGVGAAMFALLGLAFVYKKK